MVVLAVEKKKLSKFASESKKPTVEERIFVKSKAMDLKDLQQGINLSLNSRGCFSVETLTLLILLNAKANEKGMIDFLDSFVKLNVAVIASQINNSLRGGPGRAP
jgi:hypothetical protein